MTTFNFVCVFIFGVCFNAVLTAEDIAEDYEELSNKLRPVGRSYTLTTCDVKTQIGYTCLTCNRALHCYVGNVAILVDCYGPFRYCNDGHCSRFQGAKCTESNAAPGSLNSTIQTDTASVATSSETSTKMLTGVTESLAATVTETVIIPDEKTTTKSDVSTTVAVNTSSTLAVDTSSNVV